MAIDASIALGIKPVQIENPLNNMAKFYNIQNDMQTNQMNQMKMDEANRVHGADIAFKNALRGIRDPNSPEGQLETDRVYFDAGFGDKRAAMRASEEASRKAYNEEQKQLEEEGYAAHREISSDPTDERIAERNRQIQNDIRYSADKKALAADNAGRLINMPYEQRKIEMAQAGATVAERKPSIIQQNTGSHANVLTVPAFGGATTTLSSTPMGLTPEQQLGVRVGYTEGSASLDARNKSLNAKIAELNAPGTTPERAKALEGEIQQDRRSISAQQEDQESIRRADQQAKEPRQELQNLLRDRAARVAKLGAAAKNDPEVKGMTARINYLTTHPDQIINPKRAVYHVESPDGTIRGYNALDEEISKTKPGVGKGTPENTKTMAALPGAIDEMEQGLKNIDLLVGKPEIKDVNGKITQKQTPVHAGFRNSVGMGFPGARFAPGSDSAGFHAIYSQVRGEAFMTAYKELKGGGSITEVEGTKGTAAITRMDTATSEKDFFEAAREFQAVIRRGLVRAKAKRAAAEAAAGGGTWTDIN